MVADGAITAFQAAWRGGRIPIPIVEPGWAVGRFGDRTIEVLDDDPYVLLDAPGTGWAAVERYARAQGIAVDDPVRQVAAEYQLNPITVSRAYQELADEALVEKRRGLGMFVTDQASKKLLGNERERFLKEEWPVVLERIQRLGLTVEDLLEELVGEIYDEYDGARQDVDAKAAEQLEVLDGGMILEDLEGMLGIELPVALKALTLMPAELPESETTLMVETSAVRNAVQLCAPQIISPSGWRSP